MWWWFRQFRCCGRAECWANSGTLVIRQEILPWLGFRRPRLPQSFTLPYIFQRFSWFKSGNTGLNLTLHQLQVAACCFDLCSQRATNNSFHGPMCRATSHEPAPDHGCGLCTYRILTPGCNVSAPLILRLDAAAFCGLSRFLVVHYYIRLPGTHLCDPQPNAITP